MANESDVVHLTQTVRVAPADAFDLWTSPEHVRRWWQPSDDAKCTLCEIDLRVRGTYRLDLHYSDGRGDCKAWGTFLEVDRPRKLIYTWNAETYEGNVYETTVTVEFVAVRNGTEVRLTHRGLPDKAGPGHRDGWIAMLLSFATHCS